MSKILVVDDEHSILTLLRFNLEKTGYEVIQAMDGNQALHMALHEQPDCIILDVMLPKMDGIEVCKELRKAECMVPIIMLTAKDEEFDKVLGLELGADDYMTKPFSPREVVAHVRALLRRSNQYSQPQEVSKEEEVLKLGVLTVYVDRYEALRNDELLRLTPKEFELLAYFIRNRGRVLTRDHLLEVIWNYDFTGDSRIVDVHVSHLREKIEDDPKAPSYIQTVRGIGYKMIGE